MATFIHTADWHIGNSFSRFDREKRKKLNRAILIAVESIFMVAHKNHIPLVLCAGDTIDNGQLADKANLFELFNIVKKYPHIKVVMIAGNHDPLVTNNIYFRVNPQNYPENLELVIEDRIINFPEWDVKIFASSLKEKNGNYNPLRWINRSDIDERMINVGLAHGSIKNEQFEGNNFPIEPDFARRIGLDYLALGDWHSSKKIDDFTYYPGVPEPLQFEDKGYPLKVTIGKRGEIPKVESITGISQYRWNQKELTISDQTFEAFKGGLETVPEKEIRKIAIDGFLSAEKYEQYRDVLAINRSRYYEVVDNVTITPDDKALVETADGYMRETVRRLLQLKNSSEPLSEELFNGALPVDRENIRSLGRRISKNEIIDRALLKVYSHFKR